MNPIEKIKEVVNRLDGNSTSEDFFNVGCAVESICRNTEFESHSSENEDVPSINHSTRPLPPMDKVKDFIQLPHLIINPINSVQNARAQLLLESELLRKDFEEAYTCNEYIRDKNAINKKSLSWTTLVTITFRTRSIASISSETGKSIGSILTDVDSINVKFLK